MGAWGTGTFDNDDAQDWVERLDGQAPEATLTAVFEAIPDGGYLEAPDCSIVLAAAEVVAGLNGRPTDHLPNSVAGWIQRHAGSVGEELVSRARAAVERVRAHSELRDLWSEVSDFDDWEAKLGDLMTRLAPV